MILLILQFLLIPNVIMGFNINIINNLSQLRQGHWLYVGGSGSGNYSTIQSAIDNSSDGDMIYVYAGIYQETIRIDKSLLLNGEDKNFTIIDGSKNKYVVELYANDTKISNFTIQNCSTDGLLIDCSRSIVDNNIIQHNEYLGLAMRNSTSAIISNNVFMNNERGLCLCLCCSNTYIFNNIIKNNDYCGLYIYLSCNNHVFNNSFEKNKCGIILSKSWNNSVYYNTIQSCRRCSLNLFESLNNTINNNNFIHSIICAFFICCNNHWNGNYWHKPRIFPKPIIGVMKEPGIKPALEFDWHPAQEPYDIT